MNTKEVIDKIFKDPGIKYELTEFEDLGKVEDMIEIFSKPGTGKQTGKIIYYITPLAPMHSGKKEIQVYVEGGKSAPEEIVRQLWIYKLINYYGYDKDQIELEIPVQFGTEVGTKYADIAVYWNNTKETVKLLFEVKKPKRKDGIEQLKSYIGAKGNPIGIWSNGADRLILYKPDNKDFDTLSEIPKKGEEAKDVLAAKRTLKQLKKSFNFKKIIQDLEELVLAKSGLDEFNEIFKIIFAKLWDEKQALENKRERPNQEVGFTKFEDPELTYERINSLFKKACREWPGIFDDNENIKLRKDHLQVCVGPIEDKRILGSNLRIMDDAFEYLLPTEAKKKKGQFFTPRHVIDMCVRILNPKEYEYIMDPSCGSAGFLVHAMEWAYPAFTTEEQETRKHKYAAKYLWGIDFEARAAKTSRALMLIAGDGHSNIFGPDVDSLDLRTWYGTKNGKFLINALSRNSQLLKAKIPSNETFKDEDKSWEYFDELNFDIILTNPPFAGERKDRKELIHYELAQPALKRAKDKTPKEERDVLFIERIIKWLRPGGRAAIVLPQGKFNNSSLAFIREWILRKARLLAVVGLNVNTFKPHTGTKTSVLFIQKYTEDELEHIKNVQQEVENQTPDYQKQIEELLYKFKNETDVAEEEIPEDIFELMLEEFPEPEVTEADNDDGGEEQDIEESQTLEEQLEQAQEKIDELKTQLLRAKQNLDGLNDEIEALKKTQKEEEKLLKEKYDEQINKLSEQKKSIKLVGSKEKKEGLKAQKSELSEEIKKLKIEKKESLKKLKDDYKTKINLLKEKNKEKQNLYKAEIKSLEKQIPLAEYELKLLTNKGKLELIAQDEDLINKLKQRYIDAEVAKRLDYPIFMAVSQRSGKDNSGEYVYMQDENGNYIEDNNGNPLVDQDLVNLQLTKEDLQNIENIPEDQMCIAEAFIKFAKQQNFNFWKD